MKVLIYTHEFPPFLGGLATTSFKLSDGISKAGLGVTVLAPLYSEEDKKLDQSLNFRVVRMGKLARNHGIPSPIKEASGFLSLTKVLSEIKPDVVIFITREAHSAGGLLPNMPFRAIVRVAGYEALRYLLGKKVSNRVLGIPMKRLYMKAYKIISPSLSTKELLEKAGIPMDKIDVIYNGVNSHMLSQEPNSRILEGLRSKFNIKSSEKLVLTVARLVPGKGQDAVIRAMPRVLRECNGFKYLIVGEGGYKKRLKQLCEKEGVSSKVIFAGAVPHNEVVNFYDLCDVFIMPNRTIKNAENIEGLPNVVLEAASRGKPIIAGIPGGSKEVFEHGKSGYVVNGENIDEIATCILDLLKNEGRASAFGLSAKQRIEKIFTEEKMIDSYLEVIKI
ncbi:MAG: glycosyltransferase family 4 protein [Candidatus Dadabacteria bacterium]|nr:glycosyltransferase family 4 protein [Candidatus Dadabacteria bacterium]